MGGCVVSGVSSPGGRHRMDRLGESRVRPLLDEFNSEETGLGLNAYTQSGYSNTYRDLGWIREERTLW